MASGSTVTSPSNMSFALVGAYFMAGRPLPADIRVTTKPDGTPLSPITTKAGNINKPALRSVSSNGNITSVKAEVSPTISSSSSAITISWEHERTLERLVGRDATNELLRSFDPCKTLSTGQPFQTRPMSNAKDRYDLHEVIERIWQGRLCHETGKNQCMWIWVPGSVVPRYLQERFNRRQQETASKKRASSPLAQQVTTHPSQSTAMHSVNPASTAAVARNVDPAHAPQLAGWGQFAKEADADWQYKHSSGFATAQRAAGEANPRPVVSNPLVFKEKFVERREPEKLVVDAGPKTAVIPPHLRKAMAVAAAAREEAEATHNTVNSFWVAAKLPNPCGT